jgi:tetraacyldisaccharide 4'-kinase
VRRFAEKILSGPPAPLLPLLLPLSLIYRVLAALHRLSYRLSLMRIAKLPRPVISIGNLSTGGGGKTPLVMWLAQKLGSMGVRTAVLTRGYGRLERSTLIAGTDDDWKRVGDEPALMAEKLTGVPVAVSSNRHRGGMKVLGIQDVDLFILDDGFGHHALHKDLEIVAIDDLRRFGKGRMLPAGILREPVGRLKDAQFVVVTKARQRDPGFEKEMRNYSGAFFLWTDYRPDRLVSVGRLEPDGKASVPEGPFLAFCGIADPEGFRRSLDRMGIETLKLLTFPDHHPYTASDVSVVVEKAGDLGATALVTTEKDAVRWPKGTGPLPCFALAMELVFLDGEACFMDAVISVVRQQGKTTG